MLNGVAVGTIDRGEFIERIIDGAATIDADKPVLIAQYSNGTDFDGVTSDPFMMLVPPFEQFLASYVVTTPATGFETNFINVVAPTAAIGSITLDGLAIPSGSFSPVGTSSFSAAQVPVELGAHALKGSQPFGVFVYGFDQFDSYGYPGGLAVASIASVDHLLLTPCRRRWRWAPTRVCRRASAMPTTRRFRECASTSRCRARTRARASQ